MKNIRQIILTTLLVLFPLMLIAQNRRGEQGQAASEDHHKKLQSWVDAKNHEINWHIKVVDQDGKPLEGVALKLHVRQWFESTPGNVDAVPVKYGGKTDSAGSFAVKHAKGDSLEIDAIELAGYEASPKARHPDLSVERTPEKPQIIKMWKRRGAEPMIVGKKFFGLVPDGSVYTVDFLQEKKIEGNSAPGDIRIQITRSAEIKPKEKFNWAFTIHGIDGGIMRSTNEFSYEAPESGYLPMYQFSMSPTNAEWRKEIKDAQFFLKSRDGKVYGRFMLNVIPDYKEKGIFDIQYFINPSGSRNLEYDPLKKLNR